MDCLGVGATILTGLLVLAYYIGYKYGLQKGFKNGKLSSNDRE